MQELQNEAAQIALELYNISERESQLRNRMRELKGAIDQESSKRDDSEDK